MFLNRPIENFMCIQNNTFTYIFVQLSNKYYGNPNGYHIKSILLKHLKSQCLLSMKNIWKEIIGFTGGICLSVQLIPQIAKAIKTKKTADISYLFLVISITGSIIVLVYGILIDSLSITATISFSLLLKIVLLVLKKKYDAHVCQIHNIPFNTTHQTASRNHM